MINFEIQGGSMEDVTNNDNNSTKDLVQDSPISYPKKKKACFLALFLSGALSLLLYLALVPIGLEIRNREETVLVLPTKSPNASLVLLLGIKGVWFSSLYIKPSTELPTNLTLDLFLTYEKGWSQYIPTDLSVRDDVLKCTLRSYGCEFQVDDIHIHYYLLVDASSEYLPASGVALDVKLRGRKTWFYLTGILSIPVIVITIIIISGIFCKKMLKNRDRK